jgi:hypothetical protein
MWEQRGNFHENTTINYFLTVEPILTNNIPIDSAQQAEDHGNIKKARISFRGATGEFSNKFTP